MTAHKSIVFELDDEVLAELDAGQVLVTVWGDDNPPTIAFRRNAGAVWGPPIEAYHVEGDWPPARTVIRAIDHVSVKSLEDGNPYAQNASMAAGRYDDGNDRSLGVAVVDALLAIAAELRATRGAS